MGLIDFMIEVWYGPGTCVSGGCDNPTIDLTNHCLPCHEDMEELPTEDRERAYVKANISEWNRLMDKYEDIR